ncbi:CaiB/BaiF CoA transferase family protein [Chloroflexota bacterium]
MDMPLEGIKVVELSTWIVGPVASTILGECGADVIKVENIEGGDTLRGLQSSGVNLGNVRHFWELCNRNKRGIAVNLKHELGRKIIYQLLEKADIFVTNLRLGSLERLSLDYDSVNQLNPQIIYAHASGYGPKGPDRDKPAFDEVAFWARSGIMSILGEPGTPPPPLRGAMGDLPTAALLAGNILLALFVRERTGIGQQVTVSLLSAGMWVAGWDIQSALSTGQDIPRVSRKTIANPLYNTYQTKDEKWIQFQMVQTDRYWSPLCRALGSEDLENDSRFDSHEKRCANSTLVISILDEVIATKTRDEWVERFDGHDLVWAPVVTISEVIHDPQVLENEYVVNFDHPILGSLKLPAIPFQLSKTPLKPRSPAPEMGQHTEEVLLEIGYDWDDITRFKYEGVII